VGEVEALGWQAADESLAEEALSQALEFFPRFSSNKIRGLEA